MYLIAAVAGTLEAPRAQTLVGPRNVVLERVGGGTHGVTQKLWAVERVRGGLDAVVKQWE